MGKNSPISQSLQFPSTSCYQKWTQILILFSVTFLIALFILMQHNYYFNYSRTYKNYHILATNSIPSYNWSLSRLGPATVPTRKRDIKKLENNLLSITDFEKVFPKNGTYPFDVESRLKNSIDIQKLRLWNLEKFCAGTSYKFDTDLEIPSLTLFPGTKVFECRVPKTG